MPNLLPIAGTLLLSAACAAPALASPCGAQATTMLRRFGLINSEQNTPNLFSSTSSAASTEPLHPGGVAALPVTQDQQHHANEMILQAVSADHSGDQGQCDVDLAAARHDLGER